MHDVSFRLLSTGTNLIAIGTDAVAIGVSARVGENFGERQIRAAPTSLVLRSLDGSISEFGVPYGRWVPYIGRPLFNHDVLTIRVDLTSPKAIVITFAINGKFGESIRRILPDPQGLQVHLVVDYSAVGASVEIL